MSGMSLVEIFILAGVLSSSSAEDVADEEVAVGVGVVLTGEAEPFANGTADGSIRKCKFQCNEILRYIVFTQK